MVVGVEDGCTVGDDEGEELGWREIEGACDTDGVDEGNTDNVGAGVDFFLLVFPRLCLVTIDSLRCAEC